MKAPAPQRTLVLASTSPYRRQSLQRLGLTFEAVDPRVDEDAHKTTGLSPRALVELLAVEKARACSARYPQAVIIGGDQCAEIDGQALGKPGTVERAAEQLQRLCGRTHRLLTALCVLDSASGQELVRVDEHLLTVRPLSNAQVRRYVELDLPLDCAGSYKIESLGIALFERIEGTDPSAITGLPLMTLAAMLTLVGIDVFAPQEAQRS